MVDRSYVQANNASRERLERLTKTLTPSQLQIELGEGWTVASALGHAGFWDRWQAMRWEKMIAGEWHADDESILEVEPLANDSLHPFWAGVTDPNVGQIALDAATRLDAIVESAPDELIARILASESAFLANRFRHRNEHLDHIEHSIAQAQAKADEEIVRVYVGKNAESRRRLAGIVERLRAEDLSLPTEPTEEGSWTVAQVLAHVLFWDRSMEARWRQALERAGENGPVDIVGIPMELTDSINLPLADLISDWTEKLGLDLANGALSAAETLDRLIEQNAHRLPPGALSTRPNALSRWGHRESHLAAVEKALAAARPSAKVSDTGYSARNDSSRADLDALYARLSPVDLARPVGDGQWTVGQHIGHMAFWDRFLATRWRAALDGKGAGLQPSYLPHDTADLLNATLPGSWAERAATAGTGLLDEARAAMVEVDGIIGGLPADTPLARILAERPSLLDRSIHRSEHARQVRASLDG